MPAPTDTQDSDSITPQSSKPVPATIGFYTRWPAAGRNANIQYAADVCRSTLNARKVSLGPQADHAPTHRTSISTYFKRMRKAGKTH